MVTVEERVSKLEGGAEHYATKADLANLKADLTLRFAGLQFLGLAALAAILKLLPRA